ncbi:cilia-and flagella-associated protein 96 [Halyomorpha halys]|uniref:cilia-and flagella-associated protein 96 n=1 Tax=Halyomorpha halys TaxID=286706 RepID=UPI0006D51F65|nr:UPF0602 protein C4orf47 homolog [Halyomorpha halys]
MAKTKISPAPPDIGFHYGKTDLERIGFFAELGYLHGGGYSPPITIPQIRDPKNRQMFPEFPKIKTTGLQDCYFDKAFKRLFIGEANYDPLRSALRERMEQAKKIRGLFRPTSYTHLQACRGDYFGCFTTMVRAFDPRARSMPKTDVKDANKKNLLFIPSSPGKKGGYGYLDITINPYPRYTSSPYEIKPEKIKIDPKKKVTNWLPPSPPGFFQTYYQSQTAYVRMVPAVWSLFGLFRPPNPAKSLGGCMDGCFDKWPSHSPDHYIDPWKVQQGEKPKAELKPKKAEERPQVWFPNGTGKTNFSPSVLQTNVHICTNAKNWRNIKPVTYTREFI